MKKLLLILSGIMMITSIMAQVPQGITHQAVMRDSQNQPIVESPIGVRISIIQGEVDGEAVYVETHTPMSNANGLITYIIGEGAIESGVFTEIDWSSGPYFLKTEADPMGGTDYTITGITQFHSVPYALYAEESAEKEGTYAGEIKYWDGSAWTAIQPGEHGQTLSFCNGVPTWGPCSDDIYWLTLVTNPTQGGAATGGGEYEVGSEVLITAIPNEGWEFISWTGDTQFLDNPNTANTTVTMPANNVTLMANFQEEDELETGTVTDIDGNVYQTVIIGNQEWMAENLRVTKYNNGDTIPTGLSNTEWSNTTEGAYAIYPHGSVDGLNSDEDVLEAYGALYNWYAVVDERGLCPAGWSAPMDAQWTQLVDYVVSQGFPDSNIVNGAGNALKSCLQVDSPLDGCFAVWHPRWNAHGTHHGFDEFGFSALPGGYRGPGYVSVGHSGLWWSSSPYGGFGHARTRFMNSSGGRVNRGYASWSSGLSVRCFRDIVRTEDE